MKLILLITDVGGPVALHTLLSEVPAHIRCPLLVLPSSEVGLLESSAAALRRTTALPINMVQYRTRLEPGCVYFGAAGTTYRMVSSDTALLLESALVGKDDEPVRRTIENLLAAFGDQLTVVYLSGRGRRAEIQACCALLEKSGCKTIVMNRSETLVSDMGQQVLADCQSAVELSATDISVFLDTQPASTKASHRPPKITSR